MTSTAQSTSGNSQSASTDTLKQVRNIILVASGKGGVGKSTTAVNLALALNATGQKVGLMDADIYGPSQQTMLGVEDGTKPELIDEQYLRPIERFNLKTMSVGYLSAQRTAMIWRGPMATRALQQMLEQTLWGTLDYLIIDMPPGTGDIPISLAQKLSVTGAVIVTTPQEVALCDARRAIEMFSKVNIPVLGYIENMAVFHCPECGHKEHIFGHDGAQQLQDRYGVPLLGSIALQGDIGLDVDQGTPSLSKNLNSTISRQYLSMASLVMIEVNKLNSSGRASVPDIRIVD